MSLLNQKPLIDIKAVVDTVSTNVNTIITTIAGHTSSLSAILAKLPVDTGTLLGSTDPRLNNLNAPISAIPTSAVNQVIILTVTNISITGQIIVISSVDTDKAFTICQPFYNVNTTDATKPPAASAEIISSTQVEVKGVAGTQALIYVVELK